MSEKGNCQVCSTLCESWCSLCRTVFYCSKEHQKQDWANHKDKCTRTKYSMEENEKLGRFLVATEDVKADTLLFRDRPLVLAFRTGLLDSDDSICLGCYKLQSNIDSSTEEDEESCESHSCCLKCGLPVCSEECSSQYFHKHFECKLLREAARAKTGPTAIPGSSKDDSSQTETVTSSGLTDDQKESFIQNLLYFRCLLLKNVNLDHWNQLMSLQSNNEYREDLSNLENTARIFEEMRNVLKIIGHPTINTISKPDLHKILGILDTNTIDFKISSNVELTGIYPTFSLVEYSCIPSSKYYFVPPPPADPGKKGNRATYDLYVRSAVRLKKGDHVSITITNILWNTQKRREELKKMKYFWCECSRCIDPHELGSNFSSILCPLPECKAISIPVPKQATPAVGNPTELSGTPPSPTSLMSPGVSTDREYQWQCTNAKCGKTCETWQVKKVDSKLSETIGKLSAKASVQVYKDMLSQFDQLVHPDYYLNFVVNHSLIQMMGHDSASRNNKEILEDKLSICNRLLGTIKKLDPGLAKLNIFAAVVYFEMHSAILGLVGGEGDEDYKILRKNPETVKLGRIYLQKCIDCFKYELLSRRETKLKVLATKKIEYLNMLIKHA
ncbi:unnamed protein product [Allacma fusca]|uniref:MYND-type domain-containing protein n=1 Tax=Allacma fusca TaxID=39272 RepID=A0A8J2Q273_9HEXA|nr:unnamed protein product [Allacma fusca]